MIDTPARQPYPTIVKKIAIVRKLGSVLNMVDVNRKQRRISLTDNLG
jgi:hypothetical protein